MPNLYARQTALSNAVGRIDYISSSDRQENLLATCDGAADLLDGQYWSVLAQESRAAYETYAQKTKTVIDRSTGAQIEKKTKCVEAREIQFPLPNELLDRMTPDEILGKVISSAQSFLDRPVAGALHLNKKKNNLHVHLIYSERELLDAPEVKIAPRALFFDERGKRCYKKAEILDDAGELREGCKIVPKGEIYESRCFGSVEQKYSRKGWLEEAKSEWLLPLLNGDLRGENEITQYDPDSGELPQQHIGKGTPADVAARIEEYNDGVREYNAHVRAGAIPLEDARAIQAEVKKSPRKNGAFLSFLRELRDRLLHRRDVDALIGAADRRRQTAKKRSHDRGGR